MKGRVMGDRELKSVWQTAIERLFFVCACFSVLSVAAITIYIFAKGSPAMFEVGIKNFLLGREWKPGELKFGILPMILASVYTTIGAVAAGTIIGLFTAVFLAEIAPDWLVRILKPAIQLLGGIPSVVYGFCALMIIVPLISKYLGGVGNSLLAGIIILSIMILPTIISISETSIRAVPSTYKEGSLALGATKIQTIFKVILPAARSGILTSVILSTGRAVGETMAVIMVIGNNPAIPHSFLEPVRTLTTNIVTEMGYASGLHQGALFSTGVVLYIFIMVLNAILNLVIKKAGEKYE